MTDLIKEELNVKQVVFEKELDRYMNLALKPDFKAAGPVLGSRIKAFGAALAKADPKATAAALESDGQVSMELDGETFAITKELVDIRISAKEGFAVAMENNVFVILDTTITEDLLAEGLAREMISKIQQMRKQHDFEMTDRIKIFCSCDPAVEKALAEHRGYIMKETLAVEVIEKTEGLDEYDLNGHKTGISVEKI